MFKQIYTKYVNITLNIQICICTADALTRTLDANQNASTAVTARIDAMNKKFHKTKLQQIIFIKYKLQEKCNHQKKNKQKKNNPPPTNTS